MDLQTLHMIRILGSQLSIDFCPKARDRDTFCLWMLSHRIIMNHCDKALDDHSVGTKADQITQPHTISGNKSGERHAMMIL
jgi:hypothetical protein